MSIIVTSYYVLQKQKNGTSNQVKMIAMRRDIFSVKRHFQNWYYLFCLPLTNMDGVLFAQEIIINFPRFKPFFWKTWERLLVLIFHKEPYFARKCNRFVVLDMLYYMHFVVYFYTSTWIYTYTNTYDHNSLSPKMSIT